MKLIIEDDEGRKTVVPVVREEITIGRQDGNTIRLTERNVSRRHARLVKENGSLVIEDLGSYNGVRVNGEKISSPTAIKEGDLVEIGDYDLGIQGKFDATSKQSTIPPTSKANLSRAPAAAAPPPAPPPAPAAPPPSPAMTQESAPPSQATPGPTAGGATAIIRVSDIMKSAPQTEVHDLERNQMPSLVGLAGPFRARQFFLQRSEVKFGRTDENDIVVDHQSVSRSHAKFVLEDGQWKVMDNKSANGVHVNGDPYAVSNLNPGDTVELGHVKFRFCGPGEKFTPPPEKKDDDKPQGLKPTTAELIAGASNRSSTPVPQAKKSGPPVGMIAGIVGVVAVIAVVAFLMLGKKSKPSNPEEYTGEDAAQHGEMLFKQHKYIEAQGFFERAGDAPSPSKKKVADEAKGQEAYQAIKGAVDAGDGDKAIAALEKCPEGTYFCGKAQSELADPAKAAQAKKHIAAAKAAQASGDNGKCVAEAQLVLKTDPANADAQSLVSACSPQQQAAQQAPKPQAAPENKEAKAAKLAKSSLAKLSARDFQGAVNDCKAALAQSPTDETTLGNCYKSLGYGYAYLSQKEQAVQWLEKYLPYCTNDCPQVHQFIGH
jgi:pSer/pThr/pTyr-binding forkhead associated (FHA) protein